MALSWLILTFFALIVHSSPTTRIETSEVFLFDDGLTFTSSAPKHYDLFQARDSCEKVHAGVLPVIQTQEDSSRITSILRGASCGDTADYVWLNASKINSSSYIWSNKKEVDFKSLPMEPDHACYSRCCALAYSLKTITIHEKDCHQQVGALMCFIPSTSNFAKNMDTLKLNEDSRIARLHELIHDMNDELASMTSSLQDRDSSRSDDLRFLAIMFMVAFTLVLLLTIWMCVLHYKIRNHLNPMFLGTKSTYEVCPSTATPEGV